MAAIVAATNDRGNRGIEALQEQAGYVSPRYGRFLVSS
jgi:hypothetical protein